MTWLHTLQLSIINRKQRFAPIYNSGSYRTWLTDPASIMTFRRYKEIKPGPNETDKSPMHGLSHMLHKETVGVSKALTTTMLF